MGVEYFLCEEGGALDGEKGDLEFVRVGGHGRRRREREVEVVEFGYEEG